MQLIIILSSLPSGTSFRTYLLTKSELPTSGAVVPVAVVAETALLSKLS